MVLDLLPRDSSARLSLARGGECTTRGVCARSLGVYEYRSRRVALEEPLGEWCSDRADGVDLTDCDGGETDMCGVCRECDDCCCCVELETLSLPAGCSDKREKAVLVLARLRRRALVEVVVLLEEESSPRDEVSGIEFVGDDAVAGPEKTPESGRMRRVADERGVWNEADAAAELFTSEVAEASGVPNREEPFWSGWNDMNIEADVAADEWSPVPDEESPSEMGDWLQ